MKILSLGALFEHTKGSNLNELDLSMNNVVFDTHGGFRLDNMRVLKKQRVGLLNVLVIQNLVNDNLLEINLSDNPIVNDESLLEFFRRLNKLQVLELRNVSLGNLEDIHLNFKLFKCDLAFNKLRSLNRVSFSGLTNLAYLDLSFNQISYIQMSTFESTKNLEKLNLESNRIRSIDNSSNNFLETVPPLDFVNIFKDITSKLTEIILNNNRIQFFSKRLIPYSKKVKKIVLDSNEIGIFEKD